MTVATASRDRVRRFGQRHARTGFDIRARHELDRQGLGVVGLAELDRLFPLLDRRLQLDLGQVGEQPADLIRPIAAKVRTAQRLRPKGIVGR